jgi:hypothetical protein
VPVKQPFDYLEGGESLEEFLDQFPTVSREQAVAVLSASKESLLNTPTSTQARMELMSQAGERRTLSDGPQRHHGRFQGR